MRNLCANSRTGTEAVSSLTQARLRRALEKEHLNPIPEPAVAGPYVEVT